MSRIVGALLAAMSTASLLAQTPPWENPLMMAWSADGVTFDPPALFQDSAGVPSVARWRGDTLACVFQWFRQPQPSPTWDRVAVKFSYDAGSSWTEPTPIVINGLPPNYQRPFDPTLAVLGGDSLRIYFSSSEGMPMNLDSTVNTYSAVSTDGIHYTFEPGARVDVVDNRVIDPAVIHFGPGWHYASPVGAPQAGAYHYVSPDGITFNAVPTIPSDAQHNWTGNYVVADANDLRFYGSGQNGIWYNSSPNGGQWNGFVSTNVMGGDPTVVRVDSASWLMVYVGPPYATNVAERSLTGALQVFPVPASDQLVVRASGGGRLMVCDVQGRPMLDRRMSAEDRLDVATWPAGCYVFRLVMEDGVLEERVLVE
ncbi:MAG: T9SS type A sorting domain-containing protein [Flavobacteriales bacterium]|nr:T9SS type A sorting domain-containing protein [Flavobacteriales bacterium]